MITIDNACHKRYIAEIHGLVQNLHDSFTILTLPWNQSSQITHWIISSSTYWRKVNHKSKSLWLSPWNKWQNMLLLLYIIKYNSAVSQMPYIRPQWIFWVHLILPTLWTPANVCFYSRVRCQTWTKQLDSIEMSWSGVKMDKGYCPFLVLILG